MAQLRRRSDEALTEQAPDQRTLEALIRLGTVMASTLSIHEATEQIVDYGCILTGLPAFLFLSMDDKTRELRAIAAEGLSEPAQHVRLRPIDLSAFDLERTGPRVVEVTSLGSPELDKIAAVEGLLTAWIAPVIVEGTRLRGLLLGLDRRRDVTPRPGRLQVFRLLMLQATSAVWSAERHEAEMKAHSELLDAEHRIAVTLQENFIHPLPRVQGVDLAVVSQTAYDPDLVGGDFHDVFKLPDGRLLILLGDVEGKGVEAAGMTETVRTAVASYALVDASPGFIFDKTNQLLLARSGGRRQFTTAFALILDVETGRATYASAGHPDPLVRTASGWRFLECHRGLPLGAFPCEYRSESIKLSRGDTLILYSDGLSEARRDEEQFGDQLLLETVLPLAGLRLEPLLDRLREAAVAHAGRLTDDLHILGLRLRRGRPPRP